MKIKGSKAIEMKKLLVFWIIGAVVLVSTRVYQMFTIVDHSKGFYSSTDFTVWIMYALLAVLTVVFVAGSFASSKIPTNKNAFSKNKILGGTSALIGLSVIVDVILQARSFIELYDGFDEQSRVTVMKLGEYLMKSGALSKLGETIFGATTAIYFFLIAVACFVDKINVSKFKILAITPVVWTIFKMLTKLIRTISYIKVSDLFYEILMLLFMMLFFMAFAQLNSKINEKGIEWKVFGYGFVAALLALICSVPRFIYSMTGGKLSEDAPMEIWALFFAVFTVVYLVSLIKRKEEATEEETVLIAEKTETEE